MRTQPLHTTTRTQPLHTQCKCRLKYLPVVRFVIERLTLQKALTLQNEKDRKLNNPMHRNTFEFSYEVDRSCTFSRTHGWSYLQSHMNMNIF